MRPIHGVLRSLGAAGLLVGLTFSCGNDTKSDPDEDDGGSGGTTSNAGGNGGTAGNGGSGGTATTGAASTTTGSPSGSGGAGNTATTASTTGAAGDSGVPQTTPGLAEPCDSDDDCESDLICLAADSNSLLEGGPANGLCTAPCDENTLCSADAACILFGEETGYCMPMCIPNNGTHDCAERADMVCDVLPVGLSCESGTECGAGTGCFYGECVLPVCLPKCRVNSDCPEGRFCDARYGECVEEDRGGSPLDAICDPDADPDECAGFCAGGGDTEARCLETCALGVYPACGSESVESGTADCLAAYTGEDVGDLGFCVGLCDCSSDCTDEGMVCISFESIEGFEEPEVQGRPGFCAPLSDQVEDDQILTCEE